MQGDDTTSNAVWSNPFKHNVTPALSNLSEAQSFESVDHFCP